MGLYLSPGLPTWASFPGCLGVSRSHEAAYRFALRFLSDMFCLVLCSVSCLENGDTDPYGPGLLGN